MPAYPVAAPLSLPVIELRPLFFAIRFFPLNLFH